MTGKGFFPQCCSSHSVEPYCQFLEFLLSIVALLRKHLPLPCPRVLPDISGFSRWCLIYFECSFMWDGRYGSSVICHTWTSSPPSTICWKCYWVAVPCGFVFTCPNGLYGCFVPGPCCLCYYALWSNWRSGFCYLQHFFFCLVLFWLVWVFVLPYEF